MERADLLYSGLMLAAVLLSLWTALLVTATFVALAPSHRKSGAAAATISVAKTHVSEKAATSRPVSEALPHGPFPGRAMRPVQ